MSPRQTTGTCWQLLLAVGLGIWPVALSCRQIVGIEPRQLKADAEPPEAAEPFCRLPNVNSPAACGQCMSQKCCDVAEQCALLVACRGLETCVRTCASDPCRDTCPFVQASTLLGIQFHDLVETCRVEKCAQECLLPWQCLGQVTWTVPNSAPPTITVTATVTGTNDLGATTTVRMCSLGDPSCEHPWVISDADASGAVTLLVPGASTATSYPLSVFLDYRRDGYLDLLYPINTPPLSFDLDVQPVASVMQKRIHFERDIATALHTTYNPEGAVVFVSLNDCNGRVPSDNVGDKWEVIWLDGGSTTPVAAAFLNPSLIVAMNLPVNAAGITRIVARLVSTQQVIGSANVVVRKGAQTVVTLVPTP